MARPARRTDALQMPPGRRIPRPPESRTALPPAPDVHPPAAIAQAGAELSALTGAIRACALCPRASERRAAGSGFVRAQVLWLKDMPSRADVREEIAFVEEAPALERALAALGLAPSLAWGSTAVRCGWARPALEDVRACSVHLLTEIEIIGPQVIVACGPRSLDAVRALDQRCGISVPERVERGVAVQLRRGLNLLWTEPLPEGVTVKEAKRRFWRDLQALPGLLA